MKYWAPRYLLRRYEILKNICVGDSFLEIGAGNLYLTRELVSFFNWGTIVDLNPFVRHFLSLLPSHISKNISLITGDFMTAEIKYRFDCIIAAEVIEHIVDDAAFVSKAYSLLKNHGQLIITVPSRMKYWSVHDENVGHLRRYEREELSRLLQCSGFVNVKITSYGFPTIMLFRALRIYLAKQEKQRHDGLDQKLRTIRSGLIPKGGLYGYAGLACNPITMAPFAALGTIFNHLDLSDGYLATAVKHSEPESLQ